MNFEKNNTKRRHKQKLSTKTKKYVVCFAKNKLPSLSYATSLVLGPQRPYFTGVGDSALGTEGARWSYSLNSESNGETDRARRSGGGTLNPRNADGFNGGTLKARKRSGDPERARERSPMGRGIRFGTLSSRGNF